MPLKSFNIVDIINSSAEEAAVPPTSPAMAHPPDSPATTIDLCESSDEHDDDEVEFVCEVQKVGRDFHDWFERLQF